MQKRNVFLYQLIPNLLSLACISIFLKYCRYICINIRNNEYFLLTNYFTRMKQQATKKLTIYFFQLFFLLIFPVAIAQQPLRVMPLGNSITFDTYEKDPRTDAYKISYRYKLYQLFSESGFFVDFVGSRRAGWYYFSDCENAGWPGIRDHELANIIQTGDAGDRFGKITNGPYLNYYPADVILLEIGTNDVIANDYNSVADVERLLNAVDTYEQQSGRPVLVLLGKIISLQNYPCGTEPRVTKYNSLLQTMATNRINNGDKLIVVDMECGAGINYSTDMIDWLHPNQSGYQKMALLWYNTLASINARPVITNIPDQTINKGGNFSAIPLDNYVSDPDDPDSGITWYISPANPQNLNITIDANRVASVTTKDPNWTGTETITFIAADKGRIVPNLRRYAQMQVVFTVNKMNNPPQIILPQQRKAYLKTLYSGYISATDSDEDDTLTLTPLILPSWCTFENQTGRLSGIPQTTGNYVFKFRAYDGKVFTDSTFVITVYPENHKPVIESEPIREAFIGTPYEYSLKATDPDESDELELFSLKIPVWLNLYNNLGLLAGNPVPESIGLYEIIIGVTDGKDSTFQNYMLEVKEATSVHTTNAENIIIKPNPFKHYLKMILPEAEGISQVSIFNSAGNQVFFRRYPGADKLSELDIDNLCLAPGIYYARITGINKTYYARLVCRE